MEKQKNFLDKFYDSMMGGIFKVFTSDMKELYHEFLGPNLESKTKNNLEKKSSASLERGHKFYSPLNDFRNHEAINPSKTPQKNNSLQKNNFFLVYSANFGI